MRERGSSFVAYILTAWVSLAVRRPAATAALLAVLATIAGGWALATLRLEGDVTELVDSRASFLRDYGAYKAAFPQHRRLNIIVIDGNDARRARAAEAALLGGLRADPQLFPHVFAPGADPFLTRHALLYLETDVLAGLVDDLAAAQPALALLARDPSLRGIADLFARTEPTESLDRLADILADTAGEVLAGRGAEISWGEALLGRNAAPRRRLIIYQGSLADDDDAVARRQAEAVDRIVAREGLDASNGVRVSMTGRGPLSASELSAAVDSIQVAGALSLALVVIVLWVGLGSLRAILAGLITLAVGLAFTAAFAAAVVGSLNVLSLTFAILFVGLGIDFAIHVILRRIGEQGSDVPGDWARLVRGLGPTISLCGLTTAVAFLSFWPTAFRGLAELGLIAAAGMLIAVAVTFTMLPALLELLRVGAKNGSRRDGGAFVTRVVDGFGRMTARYARPISITALVLLGASAIVATQLRFDFNSLNLQSRDSAAVRTLVSLHADGTITPYTLAIPVPDLAASDRAAALLRALPEVGGVKTLRDLVPADQELRLAIIDEARVLLGPAVLTPRMAARPDAAARRAAVARLSVLEGSPSIERMAAAFAEVAGRTPGDRRIARLEKLIAGDFMETMTLLREALSAGPVAIDTLPTELLARETGAGGVLRVVALPRDDLRDFAALGAFVRAVREVFPNATGRPALEAGVGEIVVDAFRQAFATSAVAIFLLLLLTLRSLADAALVMVPLLLAAGLTAATMVVASMPLNVANVIVLPLLLGMGVDNGLHIVGRFREAKSVADVYRSSTPRAVVVSVLTTLFSFAALAFAEHRGMASMGQLLAIATGFLLISTLLVLPALLAWRAKS